ncbi:DUF3224 domain-containing protein [Actinomadura parmotrematis]|uniref:DUF3224 domain-containing protein n=1 Tax=Actinomadura parmotrematis TaxID=2864039 RepID=A0ABS7FVF1_9ACTN|nr:DUF3224 domain-containing protein [Actinomadura parmotrematis]MBW8484306.1 DUF3224 domain-containing protein [Actinomadura parmotrematis]
MKQHGTGHIDVKSWEEELYLQIDPDRKLNRAHVTQRFTGVIEGEATSECLIAYVRADDSLSSIAGLTHVVGTVGGRTGEFVLQAKGGYSDGSVEVEWFVVPDSGIGGLAGLTGEGGYVLRPGDAQVDVTFSFDFA